MKQKNPELILYFFCCPGLQRKTPATGNTPDTGERSINGKSKIYRIFTAAKGNVQTISRSKPPA